MKKNSSRTGGRPSQAEAGRLREKIMDAATHLFFTEGYGATSIEAIAKYCGISKRTFYHRFKDKADVFKAVVHHIIEQLQPPNTALLFEGENLEEILLGLAPLILRGALSPQTLALHRIMLAEAVRFPELALIVHEQGLRHHAVTLIAGLLQRFSSPDRMSSENASFAAEQFLQMVTSLPQRRALGLGRPMKGKELETWTHKTVSLFLYGFKLNP